MPPTTPQPVTLYGKHALQIINGKDTYTSTAGQITVPANLVERILALGFSRRRPEPDVVKLPDVKLGIDMPEKLDEHADDPDPETAGAATASSEPDDEAAA